MATKHQHSRPTEAAPQTGSKPDGTVAPKLEIAGAIAAAYREALGCGPKRAAVHFTPPATLVVVLEKSMTVEERNLAALGEHERLRERRLVLMEALEARLRSVVEHAVGRRTLAFLSGIDTRRDVVVDLYTLEPGPDL